MTLAPRGNDLPWNFLRSSYCAEGGCVEVASLPGEGIALRDSKDDNSPVLRFTAEEWDAFIAGVLDGQFTRDALRQPTSG